MITIQWKKFKMLIVFDDSIEDTVSNKKLEPIFTKLFVCSRKLYILFSSPNHTCCFSKNVTLNSTPYFIMKISLDSCVFKW